MKTCARVLATLALGSLCACERAPVVALALSSVPAETATLEVWTWVDGAAAPAPSRFPIDAPRDIQRLGVRLPPGPQLRQQVAVGVGAFDKDGCLRGLAEARGVLAAGTDLHLREALSPVDGPCGEARPVLTGVTPTQKRTMTEAPMAIRGLGFQPGWITRVGSDDIPGVTAVSPTRMEGTLPATPGRLGPMDVAVIAPGGAVLATRKAALRFLLTNLRFQELHIPLAGLAYSRGWLAAVPEDDGASALVVTNYTFRGSGAPAVLVRNLGLGRSAQVVTFEPTNLGAVKYVTALDLDGDGKRQEVVFLSNEGVDGVPIGMEARGPASLLTYRVEGAKLTRLDYQKVDDTFLFNGGGVPRRLGAVRALPGERRESLVFYNDKVYEYQRKGGGFPLSPIMVPAKFVPGPMVLASIIPGAPAGVLIDGYFYGPLGGMFKSYDTPHAFVSLCRDFVVGDFDGDGVPDGAGSYVSLYTSFNRTPRESPEPLWATPPTILSCGKTAGALATGDLDGDGRDELACTGAANNNDGKATLFLYQYNGAAWVQVPITVSLPPGDEVTGYSVVIADLDGDGRQDIATSFVDARDGLLIAFNQSE